MTQEKIDLLNELKKHGLDPAKFKRLSTEKLKAKVKELEPKVSESSDDDKASNDDKASDDDKVSDDDKASDDTQASEDAQASENENLQNETTEQAFEKDELLSMCKEIKELALKKRYIVKARWITLIEISLNNGRINSHAIHSQFMRLLPRPTPNNSNNDLVDFYPRFQKYVETYK